MRIRFIFTLCSDRVPAISLVGSAGGIRTTGAAPGWGRGGIGGGGGRDAIGAAGIGGGGGGEVGMGAAAAAAGGGGGGGGAAAAGSGAAAAGSAFLAAGAASPPPAPTLIFTNTFPGDTVVPSSTKSSSITPATGEGTGTLVLSVSISQSTSSTETESPTAFSHLTSPSLMLSVKGGQAISLRSLSTRLLCREDCGTTNTRNSFLTNGFSCCLSKRRPRLQAAWPLVKDRFRGVERALKPLRVFLEASMAAATQVRGKRKVK